MGNLHVCVFNSLMWIEIFILIRTPATYTAHLLASCFPVYNTVGVPWGLFCKINHLGQSQLQNNSFLQTRIPGSHPSGVHLIAPLCGPVPSQKPPPSE